MMVFSLAEKADNLADKVGQHGPQNCEKADHGDASARNLRQRQHLAASRLMARAKGTFDGSAAAALPCRTEI